MLLSRTKSYRLYVCLPASMQSILTLSQKHTGKLEEEGYLYTKSGKGTFVADAKTARQSLTRNLKILFDQVVTELFVLETPVEELRTRMDDAKEQLSMEDDLVRFVTQDMQTEDVVTEGNDDTDK